MLVEKGSSENEYRGKTLEVRTRNVNIQQMAMGGFYEEIHMGALKWQFNNKIIHVNLTRECGSYGNYNQITSEIKPNSNFCC